MQQSGGRCAWSFLDPGRSSRKHDLLIALPHLGHAHVDRTEHDPCECQDEVDPLLAGDIRPGGEQARLQKIKQVAERDQDDHPADALLSAHAVPPGDELHQSWPPKCLATVSKSLSPRPERLTTIRWSFGFL